MRTHINRSPVFGAVLSLCIAASCTTAEDEAPFGRGGWADPNGGPDAAAASYESGGVGSDDSTYEDGDGGSPGDTGGAGDDEGGADDGGGEGCTRTQGYWKNHADAWPDATDEEVLCEVSWMDWLRTPTARGSFGEHWTLLAHQYIAARLNVAAGAEPADEVSGALDEATALLETCAPLADKDQASALATTLDEFNNGADGTHDCGMGGTDGGDSGGSGGSGGTEGGGETGFGEGGSVPVPG